MDVAAYQKSQEARSTSKRGAASNDEDMDTFDLSKYDSQA